MENDLSYFLRRAAQERSAAISSHDLRATRSHKELATLYENLAREITEAERDNGSTNVVQLAAQEN